MRLEIAMARRLSLRAPGIPIAVAGIALSVTVMLMSIAIAYGFKREISGKVTGFEHALTVYPSANSVYAGRGIVLDDELHATIERALPGSRVALGLRQPGLLKTDTDFEGVVFNGIASDGNPFIASQIVSGSMPTGGSDSDQLQAVLSTVTAEALQLNVGDRVTAHFFIGDALYNRRLTVAALYDTHFSDYDKINVFTPIEMLQQLCGVDSLTGGCVTIDGKAAETDTAFAALSTLLCPVGNSSLTGPEYRIETVRSSGALYFAWLDLLDTNVTVILILMGCVAGFTLVSCLFIIILERVRMIGLLKALGAGDGMVRRLFVAMAARLVCRGLLAGNAVALALLGAQWMWRVVPLDPSAYYLSYVPVSFDWWIFVALDVSVVIVSLLLLIVPSHIISTLSPSETMRYE